MYVILYHDKEKKDIDVCFESFVHLHEAQRYCEKYFDAKKINPLRYKNEDEIFYIKEVRISIFNKRGIHSW